MNACLTKSDQFDVWYPGQTYTIYLVILCWPRTMSRRNIINFVMKALYGTAAVTIHSAIECNRIANVRQEISHRRWNCITPSRRIFRLYSPLCNDVGKRCVRGISHYCSKKLSYAHRLRLEWTIIGDDCLRNVYRPT